MKYIKRVQAGEEFNITSHGQVVAKLASPSLPKRDAQVALASIAQQSKIGDVINPIDETWDADS